MAKKAETSNDPRWQFFPAQRRQVVLEGWAPKKNNENEKRILFKFKMPITGQNLKGFPSFLNEGFHAVEKEHAGGVFVSDTELEQMALEYFDTDSSKDKVQRAAGVTIQGLELSREKDGESYSTVLRFHYNVPWFRGLWKFIDTYWGMTLWLESTPSADYVPNQNEKDEGQMSLKDTTEDEEEDMPPQTRDRARAVAEA